MAGIETMKPPWVHRTTGTSGFKWTIPCHERGDEHDGAELAESGADEGHGVKFLRFLRRQYRVGGGAPQHVAREEGVAVLQGEIHHELVEREDDLHGEDVERSVVGHQKQQQTRVHRLVHDGHQEIREVEARADRQDPSGASIIFLLFFFFFFLFLLFASFRAPLLFARLTLRRIC